MKRFRPIRILLVEDNPDDIAIARRAFARKETVSDLMVARTGQDAMDILLGDRAGAGSLPDLVLLDINLPKVNGLDVLAAIRSSEAVPMVPIVVLSASAREEDIIASYRLGANSYIQKPALFDVLTRSLDVLGQYWFEVATLPT